MSLPFTKWRAMPANTALGMALWVVGWTWFLVHYYASTQDNIYTLRIAAGVALLAVFVMRINNWARMIALMANAMAILFLAAWAFISYKSGGTAAFAIKTANLVVFLAASYYLFCSSTSQFFKVHSHSADKNSDQP